MLGTRSQRVPLRSLTALTLHSDRKTASRRFPPVPQLACQGRACKTYQPNVVQCVKVGDDGAGGVEWKCEADLPKGVRFGEVTVGCEGWDGPDDPFILKGSCGLTYNLVRSSSALEDGWGGYPRKLPSSFSSALSASGSLFNSGFNLLFIALTLYLAVSFLVKLLRPLFRRFTRAAGAPRPPGGGGGGGGPGSWWPRPPPPPPSHGPPPPYTPKPAPAAPDAANQPWRPGFFTGALAGWAANAFLANSLRDRERERERERERAHGAWERAGPSLGAGEGGGFWGRGLGGGGGGWGAQQPRARGWGWGGAEQRRETGGGSGWGSARGGGGGGTGEMRRATGFGGTSVR
ncbi:hypothetical protein JCM10207_005514 [Rhodosporidiobolus poonsookiae]